MEVVKSNMHGFDVTVNTFFIDVSNCILFFTPCRPQRGLHECDQFCGRQ